MCAVRGRDVGMIFQEPMTALNPLQTIGDQVAETVRVHGAAEPRRGAGDRRRDPRARRAAAGAVSADALSARALRRPAPARRHRHGDRAAPEAPDRRRADHRARRHHPGGDPRAAAPAGRRGRHGADADHPRPRGGRRASPTGSRSCTAAASSRPAPPGRCCARCGIPTPARSSPPRRTARRASPVWRRAPLLEVEGMVREYRVARHLFRPPETLRAVDGVSFTHPRRREPRPRRRERLRQVDAGPRGARARGAAGRRGADRGRGGARRRADAAGAARQDAGRVPGPLRQLQPAAPGGAAGRRAVPPARRRPDGRRPAAPRSRRRSPTSASPPRTPTSTSTSSPAASGSASPSPGR